MKYSSNHSPDFSDFVDKAVQSAPSLPPEEKEALSKNLRQDFKILNNKLEQEFDFKAKYLLVKVIIGLFVSSYVILGFTLGFVFFQEINLVEKGKLNAAERSINSKVIMALVAGTITQTAVAFITISKYFFNSGDEKSKISNRDLSEERKALNGQEEEKGE
jgi:hypothetical protein